MTTPKLPRVAVYAACWNEGRMLPFFLRHYVWVERIVLYDNHSDDDTHEIVGYFANVELRSQDTNSLFDEHALLHVKNECWKETRGRGYDYVIAVDLDEFLYAPNVAVELSRLSEAQVSIVRPEGFNMVSERFPTGSGSIFDEVRRGAPNKRYSKCCIFQPDNITEINFQPGSHRCRPTGSLCWPETTALKLLHMRFLGLEYVLERNSGQASRRSPTNRRKGWGRHLEASEDAVRREYKELLHEAVEIVQEEPQPVDVTI